MQPYAKTVSQNAIPLIMVRCSVVVHCREHAHDHRYAYHAIEQRAIHREPHINRAVCSIMPYKKVIKHTIP